MDGMITLKWILQKCNVRVFIEVNGNVRGCTGLLILARKLNFRCRRRHLCSGLAGRLKNSAECELHTDTGRHKISCFPVKGVFFSVIAMFFEDLKCCNVFRSFVEVARGSAEPE
jgi:hypothetical protein